MHCKMLLRWGNESDCRLAVCAGIKAIKLYAWEEPFRDRINHLRYVELEQIRCVCAALHCLPTAPHDARRCTSKAAIDVVQSWLFGLS